MSFLESASETEEKVPNWRKHVVLVVDGVSSRAKYLSRKFISDDAEIIFSEGKPEVFEKYAPEAKVLIAYSKPISEEMLNKTPNCIYIQKYGTGVNNIALEYARERGIPVGNVPAANARAVAEHALALLLTIYKRLVKYHNELVINGSWISMDVCDDNYELTGKTIGLVGLGNIGRIFCELLSGFHCKVLYYDQYRLNPEQEKSLNISFTPFDELLKNSDVVSLHCPLNDSTKHLMNAKTLSMMKKNSVLLNCARGGIVDTDALRDVLASGHLLGAGIDTYELEPISKDHPFCSLPNVVLSPHDAGGSIEAIEAIVKGASYNINSMLARNIITREEWIVN